MAPPSEKTLSVVIPVYNDAASLPELFAEMLKVEETMAERGIALELIFVNDGSGDASLANLLTIKKARPATKVISLSRNFGAVAASKTGFSFVTGNAFMILAADLQDSPQQILLMLDRWLSGSKFVVSARATREDPPTTIMLSWLYYRVLKRIILPDYPRGGFDLMLMDRVMLPYMRNSTKNTNPNLYAYWLGFKPTILYYNRRKRRYGRSGWTFSKRITFFLDSLCGFSVVPIRIMSFIGFIAALLSCLYGLDIVIAAALHKVRVEGFATLAALISFFSGLILIMLGTLGEYLWRAFEAVGNKPEAVIDESFL